jgi:hypothetical protein
MLRGLPADLVRALSDTNGLILHGGAVPSEKVVSRCPRIGPPVVRDHNSFLNGYAPQDEGLYDDAAAR